MIQLQGGLKLMSMMLLGMMLLGMMWLGMMLLGMMLLGNHPAPFVVVGPPPEMRNVEVTNK